MKTLSTTLLILGEAAVLVASLLSGSAVAQSSSGGEFRYKVDYLCGGERIRVDHCRHDDDGPNFPPTTPDKDFCLVYYPDRPLSAGFIVQKVELRSDIVKKFQACGAVAGGTPAKTQPATDNHATPQTNTATNNNANTSAKDTLQMNDPYQCNKGMTITVTSCGYQLDKQYCAIKVEQNGKQAFTAVNLREQVVTGVRSCTTQASHLPPPPPKKSMAAVSGKSFNPAYLNEMPSVDTVLAWMKTSDARETASRQIWAFYELTEIIKVLSGPREFHAFLPDEQKIIGDYQVAQYSVTQSSDKTFPNNKPSEDRRYHFSRWDPNFGYNGINIWQFFSENVQAQFTQIVARDNANYAALRAEQRRVAEEALKANSQAATQASGGSPFARNDPGTLAARRCVELGGNALQCVGEGFWKGLVGMTGLDTAGIMGPEPSGLYVNGFYTNGSAPSLNFGQERVTITGCGKLVPDAFSYTLTKKPNQLLMNVNSMPTPMVIAMGSDGKLSGPGPIDVKGQIIDHYEKVWMQRYHNGVEVAGDGYWDSRPVYAPKTERCTIGAFAPAPPPPPEKNPLIQGLTSMMNSVMPQGPNGLRMAGHYAGQGGLILEFGADAVTLDCGEAHVKDAYVVENASNLIRISVKNGAAPFMLELEPNGTLAGSGSVDVTGRVVTGATDNDVVFAQRNAHCALSTLAAKQQ